MTMISRRHFVALSTASVAAPAILTGTARAAAWPQRPIHMIVPVAAGGPTDTNGRLVAEGMSKALGQKVVIENKGGAGTNLGNGYVAHSDPDGYTILYGTSSLASNGALYRALDYSPTQSLAPVSLVSEFPFFMFVPNAFPPKTVKEFIAAAKAEPGKLIMGSPGTGSGPYLAEMYFLQSADIKMTHAPYHGAAPAFIDLIPDRIQCYFGSGELLNFSRAGKVRVLASSGKKRSAAAPQVPTIKETVPSYDVLSWQGVFAPAKTPPEIISKLHAAVVKAVAEPALKKKFALGAYDIVGSTPEALKKYLAADTKKWTGVIKSAGIKIE
jgi:tripartite-type tricarboxylate transporter receptor subunit TctC